MTPAPDTPARGDAGPRVSEPFPHITKDEAERTRKTLQTYQRFGEVLDDASRQLADPDATIAALRRQVEELQGEWERKALPSCTAQTDDVLSADELRDLLSYDDEDELEQSIAVEQGTWEREGDVYRFWIEPEAALERAYTSEARIADLERRLADAERTVTTEDVRQRLLEMLSQVARPTTKQGRPRAGKYGLRAWCRENGVASSHASDFMNKKRGPHYDLLVALGLEYRILRAPSPDAIPAPQEGKPE